MNVKVASMGHVVVVVTTLVVLGGGDARRSAAAPRPHPPFVVPGATDITVDRIGRSVWRISYRAPNAGATWYTETARELEAHGWTSSDQVAYAPLNRSYSRATSLGVAVVWEWAFFSFDPLQPDVAHIRVQRAFDVPWWRHLRRLVVGTRRAIVPLPP